LASVLASVFALFTWDEIDTDWLGGCVVAYDRDYVVACFNLVEAELGRNWMREHLRGWLSSGADPGGSVSTALNVVGQAEDLMATSGLANREALLNQIAGGSEKARAEADALFILRTARETTGEYEPATHAKGGKIPDFRLSLPNNVQPLFVEVTEPMRSEAEKAAWDVLESLRASLADRSVPLDVELALERRPTQAELPRVEEAVVAVGAEAEREIALPDALGCVGRVGEVHTPRGQYLFVMTDKIGLARRQLRLKIRYRDPRVSVLLRREADQLKTGAAGIVMIGMHVAAIHACDAVTDLATAIHRYPQVSGVCLHRYGDRHSEHGFYRLRVATLVLNPKARHQLPEWAEEALGRFGADWTAPPIMPGALSPLSTHT
jgi:hypothetical protein